VVTHQLQVERRTAKAHRPKTNALPLDHATNRHSANARRGLRVLLVADWRVTGAFSKLCGWLAGDWPSTGGILNITAAAWTAGFHWWRSGNITRMQNVSQYMLVLALCLVTVCEFEL